ncbi:MAG: tyrosine-type recombinase/integrase [Petrotogales bacterium]
MNDRHRKSFRNYYDYWRTKVENQYSKDFFYLRPDGHPWNPKNLRMFLNRAVKPVHQDLLRKKLGRPPMKNDLYHPYVSRHWCATGLLIKEVISNNHWNKKKVQEWLGHEKESTTDNYIRLASQYKKAFPFDWFSRVLKYHEKDRGKHGKIKKKQENPCFGWNPSRWDERTRRDSNPRSLA